MPDCLIGHSGFVGETLLRQREFAACYRSNTIDQIRNRSFATVVCAAAPAQKWLANRDPERDRNNITHLIDRLSSVRCERFILISTVDVFKTPIGVDEESPVEEAGLHPYGAHRRLLEKFVEQTFPQHLVVRLPGLVGPGLRKNVLFDFLNDNNLHAIDSRATFQFYPMVQLWPDIEVAMAHGFKRVHLTAEPIRVQAVAEEGFNRRFEQELPNPPAIYDLQSRHAAVFGGSGRYQYSRRESLLAIRAYAQSEPRSPKP